MEKREISEKVVKEMEQIRVWCDMLEHNLVEAISQWRLKVGYQSEHLKLYYSGEELKSILCLELEMDKEKLEQILAAFCMLESRKMGELQITNTEKHYCIDVPKQGCEYAVGRIAA